jgi:hypothetical protein
VVLDVGKRLTASRVHFRAAMMKAAKDIADGGESGEDVERVVAELRRTEIEPALRNIREELDALGARRALLRLASDRVAVAGAVGCRTLGTGHSPDMEVL